MSIHFKGFFEIDTLDIALTLAQGPGQLSPLEIETAQPKIETALPEIETALSEIETALPEIEILSFELENKYQPNEGLTFELWPSIHFGKITILR